MELYHENENFISKEQKILMLLMKVAIEYQRLIPGCTFYSHV